MRNSASTSQQQLSPSRPTATSSATAAPTDSSAGSSGGSAAGSSDADLLSSIQADLDSADAGTQQANQDLTDGNASAATNDDN
jgi:hypothetical protein